MIAMSLAQIGIDQVLVSYCQTVRLSRQKLFFPRSKRRIAWELGINRGTVGRYLRLAKPANSTTGSEGGKEAKPGARVSVSRLRSFGGAPHLLNLDNLKAAVLKANWFDPEINPKLFHQSEQTPRFAIANTRLPHGRTNDLCQ
jgi:hypothetical protein